MRMSSLIPDCTLSIRFSGSKVCDLLFLAFTFAPICSARRTEGACEQQISVIIILMDGCRLGESVHCTLRLALSLALFLAALFLPFFLLWVAERVFSEANDDDDTLCSSLSPRTHYIFMGKYFFVFGTWVFCCLCSEFV